MKAGTPTAPMFEAENTGKLLGDPAKTASGGVAVVATEEALHNLAMHQKLLDRDDMAIKSPASNMRKPQSLIGFDPLLTPTSVSTTLAALDNSCDLLAEVPDNLFLTSMDGGGGGEKIRELHLSPGTQAVVHNKHKAKASLFRMRGKGSGGGNSSNSSSHRKTRSLGGGILSDTSKDNAVCVVPHQQQTKQPPPDGKVAKNGSASSSLSPPRPAGVRRATTSNSHVSPKRSEASVAKESSNNISISPATSACYSPSRKLPWQKRKSADSHSPPRGGSVGGPTRLVASAASSPVAVPVVDRQAVASMSPMIQELLSIDIGSNDSSGGADHPLQQRQPDGFLFLPSLTVVSAKPRPTSFLTGQVEEIVRSSEQEPTPWQLEFPRHEDALVAVRLCQFLETYAADECLLQLDRLVGLSRHELQRFVNGDVAKLTGPHGATVTEIHRPIVEALLECGNDIAEVKGFFTNNGAADGIGVASQKKERPHQRREVLIVERQSKFQCVFRGTMAEQQGKFRNTAEMVDLLQPGSVSLASSAAAVGTAATCTVLKDRWTAFTEVQGPTFQLLDKLAEESPFCDIAFTGHGFGAAVATIAALSYANTRTSLRVACTVTSCPKVGQSDFRWAVHSSPNLNLWRFEFGRNNQIGRPYAVGHCARFIAPPSSSANKDNSGKASATVLAYKFGVDPHQDPMAAGANAVRSLLSPATFKDKAIHDYVEMLESFGHVGSVGPSNHSSSSSWIADFHNEDGAGVRGKDNEARNMA